MTLFSVMALLLLAGGIAFLVPPVWSEARSARRLAIGVAIVFPALAIAIYGAVGTLAALRPPQAAASAASAPHAVDEAQIRAMVEKLAARMRQTPGDGDGWHMLARSYASLGRYQDSVLAYQRAAERLAPNAQLLADFADVAAMAQGRRLEGLPESIVARALQADPNNVKALSLAGTAAFEKGDYARAKAQWRRILAVVPPDAEFARSVRASIAEAERRAQQ